MEPTYTVAELSRVVARAVERAFPDEVWVTGEIRDLSRAASGHVYFALVDADAPDPAPRLPVVLFSGDKDTVNRALVRAGAGRIVDGMQVRIRGSVGHQAARGTVQLRMRWIDPDYTLGRLAAERRAVLEGLAAAGLLDRQAGLVIHPAPRRVGLVTSVGSAAHADFLHEIGGSGFGFTVLVSHATVQGPGAPESIAGALAALGRHRPDVVALVRGGGSQTDLAAFDTDVVARAVATSPFPVLTGIGHEIDETVADRVAARSVKTPTACAQLVVGMVRLYADRLSAAERALRHTSDRVLTRAGRGVDHRANRLGRLAAGRVASGDAALQRTVARLVNAPGRRARSEVARLDRAASRLSVAAARVVATAEDAVGSIAGRLAVAAPRAVVGQGRRLEAFAGVARAHDPERMLARGWSVTRTATGTLVRSPDDVALGDHVVTTTAGGPVHSVVEVPGEGRGTEGG